VINDLEVGGAETVLTRLVTASDGFRHVVVSLTGDGAFGRGLREAGIEVVGLRMQRGRPSLAAFIRLVFLFRRLRPRIVQTWLYHADLLGLIAARVAGIRAVGWNLRCSDMDLAHYGRLTRWVLAVLARLSSFPRLVIANSVAGQRFHKGLGYHPAAWEIIPNGVDTQRFRPDPLARNRWRERLGVTDETVLVGMVARRDPMKDHEGFLAAAAAVSLQVPQVAFVLAGRDVAADDQSLARLVPGVTAPIHWLGHCDDTPGLMAALDVVVSWSRFGEGAPNVVIEAMSAGLPCVVANVGDAAAIVDDSGIVVHCGDTEGLAAAVFRLAQDRNLRVALGASARIRAEGHYSLRSMVTRYESVWQRLAVLETF